MTTQAIANRLVELCRKGDFETCYKELYSPEIVSIEPEGTPNPMVKGFEGIQEKGKQFNESIEAWHGFHVEEPIVSGNHFSLVMGYECTFKGAPGPTKEEEICVYQVKDGKIIKEQFFYDVPATK